MQRGTTNDLDFPYTYPFKNFAITRFLWFDNVFSDQPKLFATGLCESFLALHARHFCLTKLLANMLKNMNLTLILRIKFFIVFTLMISQIMKGISTKLLTCLKN